MSGSLSQLAAVGLQQSTTQSSDYLPWKCSIVRPAPFAMEVKEIIPNGSQDWGKTISFSVHYSADLVTKTYLVVDILAAPNTFKVGNTDNGNSRVEQVEDIGHAMIESLEMSIGSVTHLSCPGEWLHIKETMCKPYSHRSKEFTGRTSDGGGIQSALQVLPYQPQRLYIELPVWFNEYCNAVPLVALHLSDIKFKIKLRKKAELYRFISSYSLSDVGGSDADLLKIDNIKMIAEYVFLTDQHRRIFASTDHFYLVEQIQESHASLPQNITSYSHKLDLNHMVKEIIWAGRKQNFNDSGQVSSPHYLQYFNFTGGEDGKAMGTADGDLFKTAQITINSNERVQAMDPKYYRLVHPYNANHTNVFKEFVYCYSFALEAERQNPTGTINCSRIESLNLNLAFSSGLATNMDLFVFAVSYNVVSIRSGTGALLYSS